jgi:hypothetical protein
MLAILKIRLADVWNPLDTAADPPPDLVVEVDITRKSSDKFTPFAEFGIPEVWYSTEAVFVGYALDGDVSHSAASWCEWDMSRILSTAGCSRGKLRRHRVRVRGVRPKR